MRRKIFLVLWGLASLITLWLALSPHFGPLPLYLDKVLHVVLAFVLMLGPIILTRKDKYIYAAGIVLIISGVVLEFIQLSMPDRSAELMDVVANIVGTILAFVFYSLIKRRNSE